MQIKTTLFKKTKTGAIQQWSVFAENEVITVEQGQVNGKFQQYKTVCEGKNLGRSNETSPSEQAILEAESKHAKQIKSGYVEDPSGEVVINLPMKVSVYQGKEHKIEDEFYISPKLNGVNGTYLRVDGELFLKSRGGEDYPVIPHHRQEVLTLMGLIGTDEINGEVYKHGEHLQDIQSATKKHNDLTPQLQFWIFDLPEFSKETYQERAKILSDAFDSSDCFDFIRMVPIIKSKDKEEIQKTHDFCVKQGYEGLIIRNPGGMYRHNVRSSEVFKLKEQLDAEFKCIGYKVDKNGHPVLELITSNGEHFWAKPEGDAKRKENILDNISDWVGSWVKVRYEQLSKLGKPQKPIAECLRVCNDDGTVME